MAANDDTPALQRPDTVSALERGVAVLRCFTEEQRRLSPTDLARLTGIPRPTVTRLASTLVTLGLMTQEADSERFMLGPGVVSLARVFLAGLDIRAAGTPAHAGARRGGGRLGLPGGARRTRDGADRGQSAALDHLCGAPGRRLARAAGQLGARPRLPGRGHARPSASCCSIRCGWRAAANGAASNPACSAPSAMRANTAGASRPANSTARSTRSRCRWSDRAAR